MTPRAPAARRLGQNFLVHRPSIQRIVDALELRPDDAVLEIGPGRGALTERLVEATRRLAAVELDARLAASLRERFDERQMLLIQDDVLRLPLADVCEAMRCERLVLAANLPYWISKPVAMKLILERKQIDRAVLMFQREVAARLTASPGSRDYGPLSVLAGQAFRIERLFDLPGRFFRPTPRVVSTVTRWQPRSRHGPADAELRRLRVCLAASFGRRRKTLRNNLRAALGSGAAAERLLAEAEIDGSRRAESLSPESFLRLAAKWETVPRG